MFDCAMEFITGDINILLVYSNTFDFSAIFVKDYMFDSLVCVNHFCVSRLHKLIVNSDHIIIRILVH